MRELYSGKRNMSFVNINEVYDYVRVLDANKLNVSFIYVKP